MTAYFEHKSALAVVSFSVTRRFYFGKSARFVEGAMLQHGNLFSFTLLIAAMAGNVECNLRQLLCKVWQTIR
jgi:hypothetical protein